MERDNEIVRQFVTSFTHRPTDAGTMPTSELLERLGIILDTLQGDITSNDGRLQVHAANCLRGALIRLAQAYGDRNVTARVAEIVSLTLDITGI